jgi:hypothetical protein
VSFLSWTILNPCVRDLIVTRLRNHVKKAKGTRHGPPHLPWTINCEEQEFIMKAFKPLMFAALAGLPLAVLPAMAATTDTTTTTTSPNAEATTNSSTYSQSSPMITPNTPQPSRPAANSGGGESGGNGSGGGSGK